MAEYLMQFVDQPAKETQMTNANSPLYGPAQIPAMEADLQRRVQEQNDSFFSRYSPIQSANAQSTQTVSANAPLPVTSNTGGTAVISPTVNGQGNLVIPVQKYFGQQSTAAGPVNRRDMTALSLVPPEARNNNRAFNDMLIRVGGAGIRGSAQGGLEGLGAMAETYGDIRDTQQSNALEAYKAQMKALGKRGSGNSAATSGAQVVNDDIGRALSLVREDQGSFLGNYSVVTCRQLAFSQPLVPFRQQMRTLCRIGCVQSRQTSHSTNSRPCAKPAQQAAHLVRSARLNCKTSWLYLVRWNSHRLQKTSNTIFCDCRKSTTTSSMAQAITHTALSSVGSKRNKHRPLTLQLLGRSGQP